MKMRNKLKHWLLQKLLGILRNIATDTDKAMLYNDLRKASEKKVYNDYKEKYSIHSSFIFKGEKIVLYGEGNIITGQNSYIGNYSTIQVGEGQKVIIGNNCSISHNVRIYTTSVDSNQDFNSDSPKKMKRGDVVICDGVWIGANVFINPGVTIGENAIVGANSVLVRDVEPFAIYGGVPAKFIKKKQIK